MMDCMYCRLRHTCDHYAESLRNPNFNIKHCTKFTYDSLTVDDILNRKRKPITNADYIRSMSDEELADFLMLQVQMSKASNAAEILSGFEEITKTAWLNWLKSPYKEKEE